MNIITIKSYLATLTIILIITDNVRPKGVKLSMKSWNEIHNKAKTGKNGVKLTSTSQILANIDYKSQTHFFDSLFEKMVAATAKENQPLHKCIIKRCLSDIKETSLDFSDAIKNTVLIQNVETESKKEFEIAGDQKEFAKYFVNHLKRHSILDWKLMNLNSFCTSQGEIAGYKQSSKIDSKNTIQSGLVKEYEEHLQSDLVQKFNIEQFCVEKTCLGELSSVGFHSNLDLLGGWRFYENNKNTIDNFIYLNYVQAYTQKPPEARQFVQDYAPNTFCRLIAANG